MKRQLLIANRSLPIEFNADGLPARLHLVPRGELPNKAAGVVQVLDEQALNSILTDLRSTKAKNGGLYLGEEHFIYNADMSSQAFAWAKEFEKDDQGIWATVYEPTDVGATALKNKRFKWTSFVADAEQPGAVQSLGNGRVRILKIDTVGFTNFPNGKALLTPLSNRTGTPSTGSACPDCGCQGVACDDPGNLRCPDCKNNFAVSREPADSTANQNIKNKKMKTVCTLLGLSAEADEQSVHAAVTKLQNRVTELTPLADENTKLQNRLTATESEAVDALLTEHGIKEPKMINRLKPALVPLANRADRLAYLADLGHKPLDAKAPAGTQHIINRGDGKQPAAGEPDAKALAEKITNRANELVAGGMKFERAWDQASRENRTK
jgi:uncharacterized Zn finger protein (UPF0148 family)